MPIPSAVQELIDSSGNTFHAKVARWFSAQGWLTSVSPYYMDQSQQKARELDLVVEKSWPIRDRFRNVRGDVVTRLFVECKFVAGHSVFWFTGKIQQQAENLVCSTGGFRKDNSYTKKHHYLSTCDRVAKLFASANSRGQENEPFYKALNQALNGLVSLRSNPPLRSRTEDGNEGVLAILDFPVVVCNSFANVYAADFDGQLEPSPIQQNFQLEVQYAYVDSSGRGQDDYFLLDFVEYDHLPALVSLLEQDVNACSVLL